MEYVEMLRAKRILTWFTALLVAGLVIETISFYASHGHTHNDGRLPFSSLVGAASVAALIIATFVASGLSAESANTTALIWTRPAPREMLAVRYVMVDAAAIVLGYIITVVAMLIGIGVIGALPAIDFDGAAVARSFLLGLGGSLMWYGAISFAASRLPGRGPLLAGVSWGVFPILAGLVYSHSFPLWLHDVLYALNVLNPIAWMGGMSPQGNTSIVPLSVPMRTLGAWLLAGVLLVGSIRLWSTREA